MNKAQTLLDLFSTQSIQISLPLFVANLLLAALLAWILGRVYVKFGNCISNRTLFARNFLLVTTTTMLIITIVKSSLALSLGLVGALSIIRFRAAIKEPEELSYLFLAISVGLGLGAEQTVLTVVGFFIMLAILTGRHWLRQREEKPNLYLTFTCPSPSKAELPQILEAIKAHSTDVGLKRFDQTPDLVEASFQVQFESVAKLDACSRQLRSLGDGVRVSYLEQTGLNV
jgi:uncharacterized membrane protein YhiD involved in acid resistance